MGLRVPGPDPTDDLHAVSHGWLKRFLGWTAEIDFAGALNGALTPVPASAGAASEAASGVTQLATAAEVAAGTLATKAISPLQLANARVATSLADLNARGLSFPSGTVIGMPFLDLTGSNAGYLSPSFWYIDNGKIVPLVPLIATAAATLTYLTSVIGTGKTYPNIYFDAGHTTAFVGSDAARTPWTYIDSTTGFYRIQPLSATNSGSFTINGFTTIPWTMPTGRDAEWGSGGYLVPRTGWYQAKALVRIGDGAAIGWNIGLSVKRLDQAPADQSFMSWRTVPQISNGASISRFTIEAQRTFLANKSQVLTAEMYSDGGTQGITANSCLLEITPLAG